MRLHWKNLADSAAVTQTGGDANYAVTAVQDIHLTSVFRFTELSGGTIDIDLGAAQSCSCIGLISNLSSSATVTLKGNSSESWTSPPVEETVPVAERNIIHYFTAASYRYWRVEIADSGNSDGYIEIGRVFLGTYLQMPPVAPDSGHEDEDLSSRTFSPGGQPFTVERPKRMRYEFSFPAVSESERQELRTAFREVGVGTPVWLAVWEESLDVQEPVYALFAENTLRWRKNKESGLLWQLDCSFVESR